MFQASRAFSIVSSLTSPASPATVLLQMLHFYLSFFKLAIGSDKIGNLYFYSIDVTSSWSKKPETEIMDSLHIVYQSHTARFTSEYLN